LVLPSLHCLVSLELCRAEERGVDILVEHRVLDTSKKKEREPKAKIVFTGVIFTSHFLTSYKYS